MKTVNVVLLIMFVSLSSCLHMANEAADAINDSSESISKDNFKTVPVQDLYQLDVPKYMKEMASLHPDASLEYANIYKEAYTVVIHENKQEFMDLFKELEEYDTKLSPIENYTIAQKNMFRESIDSFKAEDYDLVDINGYPARQIKLYGNVDGIDISYVVAFVEGPKNIYMIMNWTIDNRFKRLENTFEYINTTFKLL